MMAKDTRLQKTSVQMPPDLLRVIDAWPGLSRSEAIRLAIERAVYQWKLKAEELSGLAKRYEQILAPALEDFGYGDFRTVARALPAIVGGFIEENDNGPWTDEHDRELDTGELFKQLQALHASERIGVLDHIVALRHRSHRRTRQPSRGGSHDKGG